LSKFNNKGFEKIDRLVELHIKYMNKTENVTSKSFKNEKFQSKASDDQYEIFPLLNLIDLLIGLIVVMGNSLTCKRINQVLNQQDMNFIEIKNTLEKYNSIISPKDRDAKQLKNIQIQRKSNRS